MIIFGTKTLRKTLSTGAFDCPHCRQKSDYRELRPKSWGHVYWIPLIPLQTHDSYVECRSCKTSFNASILDQPAAKGADRFIAEFERACLNVAAKMALVDGHVKGSERAQIAAMMREITQNEFSIGMVDAAIVEIKESGQSVKDIVAGIAPALDDTGREKVLSAIVEIALADGTFARREKALAQTCGAALGLSKSRVRGVIGEANDYLNTKKQVEPA